MQIHHDFPSKQKLQYKLLVSFCRGSLAGISFLTNLMLFTPTVFDLVSIYQLSGKHQAHKLLIRHEAQRTQAATLWKAQHSLQRLCPIWTVPVLLSLMIYCIACLAAWEFIISFSFVQPWNQAKICNYSYLSSEVVFFNRESAAMPLK